MHLKSRRLELLLGVPLDDITETAIARLIDGHVSEDADLDYKTRLYEPNEKGNADLASDVAAMANTAGGVILIGIAENDRSEADHATPVPLRGADIGRIQQVIAARVSPLPDFDVRLLPANDQDETGFVLIAVARSARAPLAARVGDALRYSRRVGSTTRHLSESEVAAAYRARDIRAAQRADLLASIREAGQGRLDLRSEPWLALTAVPEIPGDFQVNAATATEYERRLMGHDIGQVFPMDAGLYRVRVGKRRIWADGNMAPDEQSGWAYYEFRADGSTFLAALLPTVQRYQREGEPVVQSINDIGLLRTLINSLARAARHAAVDAASGGDLLLDARILVPAGVNQILLTNAADAFPRTRSAVVGVPDDLWAEALTPVDSLNPPGRTLLSTAATLADQLAQSLGIAEYGHIGRDGVPIAGAWEKSDFAVLSDMAATG